MCSTTITTVLFDMCYVFYVHVGLLSKSRGQILCIAAVLHVLFHLDTQHNIPTEIADKVVQVAIDFVELCREHLKGLRCEIKSILSSVFSSTGYPY